MAAWSRRSGLFPSKFSDNAELQKYILEGVRPTGRVLGSGSYGTVLEVIYQCSTCAAKQLHDNLIDTGDPGVSDFIDKYQRECQLMASVSHPNLTEFLGLTFIGEARVPLLVMDRLEMSLDELLTGAPNISLLLKFSLLCDTCNGLVYLHSRQPAIVHRDLTARNVLISSSMSAKIADFGCSRIIDIHPGRLVQTMTKVPGTLVYMPPEALDDTHRYGPSLDVFSFGHLTLYCFLQEFPGDLLSSTYPDPNNREHIIARSEVERRQPYLATLETELATSHPVLLELVKQCLHNAPERRPSSVDILNKLQQEKNKENGDTGDISAQEDFDGQTTQEMLSIKSGLESDIRTLEAQKHLLSSELQSVRELLEHMSVKLIEENYQLGKFTWSKKSAKSRNSHLEVELQAMKEELEKISTKVFTRKDARETISKPLKVNQKRSLSLLLNWRQGQDMPFSMAASIQSVEVDGTLYVGGGVGEKEENMYVVMAFNTRTSKWYTLPPYSVVAFAMTTINNQLVLVGGWRKGSNVDLLGVWQMKLNEWTYPFPPMATARQVPSATSYKHWLVVAGGYGGHKSISTLEVLDADSKQWSGVISMPIAWHSMKSARIEDAWYLMGGAHNKSDIPDVYSVSLEALTSLPTPDSSSIWRQLASLNCINSSPLSLDGSLLAVGGRNDETATTVYSIQGYIPETNTWVQAGTLPLRLEKCTCITTSDTMYIIGGHDGNRHSASIYFCII